MKTSGKIAVSIIKFAYWLIGKAVSIDKEASVFYIRLVASTLPDSEILIKAIDEAEKN